MKKNIINVIMFRTPGCWCGRTWLRGSGSWSSRTCGGATRGSTSARSVLYCTVLYCTVVKTESSED